MSLIVHGISVLFIVSIPVIVAFEDRLYNRSFLNIALIDYCKSNATFQSKRLRTRGEANSVKQLSEGHFPGRGKCLLAIWFKQPYIFSSVGTRQEMWPIPRRPPSIPVTFPWYRFKARSDQGVGQWFISVMMQNRKHDHLVSRQARYSLGYRGSKLITWLESELAKDRKSFHEAMMTETS